MALSFETCPGSSDFEGHSFFKFDPSVFFHTLVNCSFMILRKSGLKVETFPLFGESMLNSHYPPSTMGAVQPQASVRQWVVLTHWILAPYRTFDPPTSTRLCPYCNQACNRCDQLLNHLWFHYHMVLVCPICVGCGSSSWQTIKSHVEVCVQQRPSITEHGCHPENLCSGALITDCKA